MKSVLVDIVTACGAKCKYCLHQYRDMTAPRFMSDKDFFKIISILHSEKYDYVYPYLSGEPILHKNFWAWVSLLSLGGTTVNTASKICFPIDIDEVIACFNTLTAPIHFDFTIDAHTQSVQDKIAKKIDNNMVFENLFAIAAEARGNRNITISVVTVVNAFNEKHLNSIRDRVQACGIKTWAPKPMGYYMGYRMQPEDEKMISEMAPAKSSRFSVVNGKVVSKMKECTKFMKPVIGVDGSVTLCCHDMLYHESEWNVLKTGSLDAIVNSPEYRAKVARGRAMQLEICKGCN